MATTEHPLVQLARQSIEAYVVRGQVLAPPEDPCEEMRARAGVFVSLHCPEGLRGCIGTIDPVCDSVAEEIISNAISAATRDPRFAAVRAGLELLADAGATRPVGVDRLTLVGHAGAGAPVGVDHQVGHRDRRQDRVVATCRQVHAPLGPGEAPVSQV